MDCSTECQMRLTYLCVKRVGMEDKNEKRGLYFL